MLSFKYYFFFFLLGVSFQMVGQDGLDKELKKTYDLEKKSIEKLIKEGDSLFNAEQIQASKDSYDRAFTLIQNSYEVDSLQLSIKRVEYFFTTKTREYIRSLQVLDFLEKNCKETNDVDCLIYIKSRLGTIHNRIGEYIKALEYFGEGLELSHKENNTRFLWELSLNRGVLFLDIGDQEQAKMDFKKALSYVDSADTKKRKPTTYLNLSASYPDHQVDSILYYSRMASLGCEKEKVNSRHCIMVYNNIAWSYYLKNMPKEALEVIRTNISWDNDNLTYKDGDDLYPGLMHTMGAIQTGLGNYEKALEYFLISQKYFERKKDVSDLITVKEDLSKLYEKRGNIKASLKTLREIRDLESLQLKVKVSKEVAKNESKNLLLEKEEVISGLEEKNSEIEKEVSKSKWLSYLLGILLCITVLVFMFRAYRSKIKYYQINEKLALTRLTSLRSSMNPHFLFNTFSTLQNYILKKDNLKANEYMTELSGLIRNVLNSSDSVYINFNKEVEVIRSYVSLQRGRFQEGFDAVFDVDPILEAQDPKIPSMVIQPYIENAIIHGFSHSPFKGKLNIKLKKENNTVVCNVRDNGIGREASEKLKNKKNETSHLSIATENTYERLEILNEIVAAKANIIINDLKNDEGLPAGTEVIITLPIIKES
ncbi:tetratricopeptide repeat-containing sensor histidine kinase [Aquimarina sp. 433]